ncbi:PREDICTED: beta-D-glucosyl crocetin beta-1,6-glucosyltransferase-like [Ipomoea nil]|uniref:beta-D-glucosyl crocetin beta-1,6-glucosyltransferase-like n=1 Tax=Ipomoea nil TaxID=35883 RepID=UPI000901A06A|nr:PREDICTED: beta-D-glucosyl crocetin beta-1,6-glucosyltransferase-like [Ipomoea nil]
MDTSQRSIRVLMFPWLAHGHICPFLVLAQALTKRNFYIYICSTPVNLSSIKKRVSEKDAISIKLVELQLPSLPDLPPHYHTTNGLPPHLMPTLKKALDMSKPGFLNLLDTLKPDLVVYDFLQPWVPAMAAAQSIPAVLFLSPGAAACSYLFHVGRGHPAEEYPFPELYLRDHEFIRNKRLFEPPEQIDGDVSDTERIDGCLDGSSSIILIKTFRQLEGKYIDQLSNLVKKRCVPVGPLVRSLVADGENPEIKEWLDMKPRCSTVFVSFGSEYFLTEEEMEEVALGLELSKVNFLWVIRFPAAEAGEKARAIGDALPEGYLERVGKRGKVVEGWAPQGMILEHSSIGGFVSHCGWSSVMEALKFGVPIIAMPMQLDQPLNARVVAAAGVGEEVVRDGEGRVEREEVARVVREVVAEKSGQRLRRRAREFSEKIMSERGEEEMDEAVQELTTLCQTKTFRQDSADVNYIRFSLGG